MRADVNNTAMAWECGRTKRILFDLTGDSDGNSAGALLDDYATFSNSPPTSSSDESFEVDYDALDAQGESAGCQNTQTAQSSVGNPFDMPAAQAPPLAQPSQPTSQGADHYIMEDPALSYLTMYPKTPNSSRVPIILVHGDFHTPKIWTEKPDGGRGWAYALADAGHVVHMVDLNLRPAQCSDLRGHQLSRFLAQSTLTATRTRYATERCKWTVCKLHDKWPGTGKDGDPTFEKYYHSLTPVYLDKASRQSHAQMVLGEMISKVGKTVLVGEGSGSQAAWLAADVLPELVYGVIAIEPMAPFGSPSRTVNGVLEFSRSIAYQPGTREYGLTDIPLIFDPPLPLDFIGSGSQTGEPRMPPLNIKQVEFSGPYGRYSLWLQSYQNFPTFTDTTKCRDCVGVRKLSQLKKVKHMVVTSHTSSHVLYDNATVTFMKQAGLDTTHKLLKKEGILGNGRLMFLETNSDAIAVKISE